MTKVGLLVECGREGLEAVVCRKIGQLLSAELGIRLDIDIVPMDNKERLIEECGTVAASLLKKGCKRVVILWDERPAWPEMGKPLCWHNDRTHILTELHKNGIRAEQAHLVCIEREFESWLLFDGQMLSCVLSTDAHPRRIRPPRNPHRLPNPKGAMNTLTKRNGGGRYVDVQFARRFADCLTSLNRLRQCDTFTRFEQRILGRP